MDPQLLLFRRQYFQLFEPDFLAWPPKQLLKDAGVQRWLYNHLFNADRSPYLPSDRYRFRVLKPLVVKIEHAIEDPEEDEISDDLMTHLSSLIASELPSEVEAVQQRSYVTFSCLPTNIQLPEDSDVDPTITLLERRNLISGSTTTGYRTWEAALHLGSYLLSNPGLIAGKSVFELGAGTGFVSILCAKHLEAKHVTTTDGDESVVEALTENLFINGLDDGRSVTASVLRWGWGLRGTWVEDEFESWPYDVVVGADITYDQRTLSALVSTLRSLFEMQPSLQVLISSAVRKAETHAMFCNACQRSGFKVEEVDFEQKPIREQTALFYATAMPLKNSLSRIMTARTLCPSGPKTIPTCFEYVLLLREGLLQQKENRSEWIVEEMKKNEGQREP